MIAAKENKGKTGILNKPDSKIKISDNSNKKTFICKCGYKFSLDPNNFSGVVCPWCGRVLNR